MKTVARTLFTAHGLPILAAGLLAIAGCGGGGGGSAAGPSTVVTGTVSMGLIKGGSVKVYKVNADGSKGTLLKQTNTDLTTGKYIADISPYTGPILVEASGTYTDEATNTPITIDPATPLHAACSNASGTVSLPVTALTEIAVQQMPTLSPAAITAANTAVSTTFHVDILNTQPVDPTAAAMFNGTTTQAQRDYTLALAAVSQMAGGADPAATMTSMATDIKNNGGALSAPAVASFQAALTDYLGSAGSGLGIEGTNLVNVGSKSILLPFSAIGTAQMAGISVTVTLPVDASVSNDFVPSPTGLTQILPDSLSLGAASPAGAPLLGSYGTATQTVKLSLVSSTSFGSGVFAILKVYYPAGKTYTFSDFTITAQKVVDISGATLANVVSLPAP
jgi:hypothetical protein